MALKDVYKEVVRAVDDDDFDRALELVKQNPGIATIKGDKGQTLLHAVSSCFRSYEPVQPIIRALVEAGADIEARDDEGWSPLHKACGPPRPNLEALQVLLELGADVEATFKDLSVLHLAVYDSSRAGAVALLIAHGADAHARDPDGAMPIHHAVSRGLAEDVRVLVENGAKLHVVTDEGLTPLGYACAFAWPEIIAYLRKHTSEDPLPAWRLAEVGLIHQQVERGEPMTVGAMLTYKPSLLTAESQLGRWTPMAIAAREGRIDMLEVLLAHGGDVNEVNDEGYNLVYIGVSNNQKGVQQWLLDHGATPAHRARKPKAAKSSFSWGKIKVDGERLFLADDADLARLRGFLGFDLPPDYVQYMKRFGSGDLNGQMYIFLPDRIIADHKCNQGIIENRFPPAEFPYENGAELFTREQVARIVIAAAVNDGDYFGFVSGETGWYLFPRDGLIESMGEDLGTVMIWLIGNGMFGKKPKLVLKPINPK